MGRNIKGVMGNKMYIDFMDIVKKPTVITVIAAWVIYRLGVWNERSNVLRALKSELSIQELWLRTSWPKERDSELKDIGYFVYKITTTSVDNAIVRGSTLLLNRNLIDSLVAYRQAIDNLNQLIDASRSFQSNVELWDKSKKSTDIKDRMLTLVRAIHSEGIADNNKPAAHSAFSRLEAQIKKEKDSKFIPIFWLATNINLFPLKESICKYL